MSTRYLSVAQATELKALGVKPGTEFGTDDSKKIAKFAVRLSITPGRYAVGKHTVKSGPNVGAKTVTLTPADAGTDYAQRLAAAERAVAVWDDPAYIARRRAAAVKRLDAVRAERPGKKKR